MAIQFKINPRTAIIAGVAVLALAGAGAYFLLFEEAPPPPPPAKVAAKPAAAVGAAKVAEGAAKPAGKPAAKPAAKPMPTNPDQVIAEIVAAESLGGYAEGAAGGLTALTGDLKMGAVDPAAIREICARALAADQLGAEIAASLKKSYDATRMPRFVELLREPIAIRMKELESGRLAAEAMKEQIEKLRKSPPPAARAKLIQDLDESMRISEVGAQFFVAIVRDVIDELGTAMRKAGKPLPDGAKLVASQMGTIETGWRRLTRTVLHVMYREASDEELAEYLKLVDSETGRWAARAIGDQVRAATHDRTRGLARDFVALLMTGQVATKPAPQPRAEAATQEQPAVKAVMKGQEAARPAPQPRAAAATQEQPAVKAEAPAGPPPYRRPDNIRELYSRYNDLMSAVVMRDRDAVRELLADGKSPNARQSDGRTALMVAATTDDVETAQMLLAKGADPNLAAPGGVTALAIARERRHAGMEKLLAQHGAKN